MTFLGMGPLEILLVLLIAFIVMGPDRMFDAARLLGKAAKEAKRFAEDLPSLSLDDEPADVPGRPRGSGDRGPNPGSSSAEAGAVDTQAPGERGQIDAGPVEFQPTGSLETPSEPEGPAKEET